MTPTLLAPLCFVLCLTLAICLTYRWARRKQDEAEVKKAAARERKLYLEKL
jgi:hypothetical protein